MSHKMFPLLYTIQDIDRLKDSVGEDAQEEARSFIYEIFDENLAINHDNTHLLYDGSNIIRKIQIPLPEISLNINNQIVFSWRFRDFEIVVLLTIEPNEDKQYVRYKTSYEIRVCNLVTQNQLVSIEKLNSYQVVYHIREIMVHAQNYKSTV